MQAGAVGSGAGDAPRSTAPGAAPPPPTARRRGGSQEERPRVTPAVTSRRGGAGGDTRLSAGGGEPSRDRTRRHPACDPQPCIRHPKSPSTPGTMPSTELPRPSHGFAERAPRARAPPCPVLDRVRSVPPTAHGRFGNCTRSRCAAPTSSITASRHPREHARFLRAAPTPTPRSRSPSPPRPGPGSVRTVDVAEQRRVDVARRAELEGQPLQGGIVEAESAHRGGSHGQRNL